MDTYKLILTIVIINILCTPVLLQAWTTGTPITSILQDGMYEQLNESSTYTTDMSKQDSVNENNGLLNLGGISAWGWFKALIWIFGILVGGLTTGAAVALMGIMDGSTIQTLGGIFLLLFTAILHLMVALEMYFIGLKNKSR